MWTTPYKFDDLPLITMPDPHGGKARVAVEVAGEASIAFKRDGTWSIETLALDATIDSRTVCVDADPIKLQALTPAGGPGVWWMLVESALLIRRKEQIENAVREALADPDLDVEDSDRSAIVVPFPRRPAPLSLVHGAA